ncbi:hypothetical protein LHYA1_G007741 [Lachnellula hyalina]|uniref:Cenp-O kinetochore centromere component n=1 Tax=Lachnellula hyalina TaxID=1316788 RepID=A0A8H8QW82_9HELO|nr:uncharacterized protein LHYA1_G007741 [Lachnellula hyalina]TVY23903.1 hypothetical protein LHYA1_G007741 [Lachnellula hyalina]
MDSTDDFIPTDDVGLQLDAEISTLQSQISVLKTQRSIQTSTILTSRSARATLVRLRSSQKPKSQPTSSSTSTLPSDTDPLLTTTKTHLQHKQENLYRICGTITTFRIRDPDPYAVDSGNVLGIRIDVSSNGKFIRPYYVMLNKPFAGSELLKVHRHTVPPCIPLAVLAENYLPTGKGATSISSNGGEKAPGTKTQDLRRFVRALRKEVVGYHNRISIIKGLRREFRLDEKESKKGKGREKVISDISAADAEARQVRIEWVDGRIGRYLVDEGGSVVKAVVMGEQGRDGEVERVLVGEMAGVGERLREVIY